MRRATFVPRALLFLAFSTGLAATAFGSGGEMASPVALAATRGSTLEWATDIETEASILSLANPQGQVHVHRFGPGVVPSLSLFDAQGAALPDGTYTWEVRVTPLDRSKPLVQSGYFTVSGGKFVEPDLAEPAELPRQKTTATKIDSISAADQIVPDDLIIDGKGCIGLGCANNEAFGQEALRLKQGVVRLRFVDTSTAANFPTHDWQLTVNDVGSGGAERFSLEDVTAATTPLTVRGGAPNNALYVDGLGNVGLGTATPMQNLHVASGSTPTVRLEQTAGTVRSWDVGANDASFFIKDVTNASKIPFRISAGAPADTLQIAPFFSAGATRALLKIGNAAETGMVHLFGPATADVFSGMGFDLDTGPAFNYGYGGATFGRSAGFFNVRADALAMPPNPSLRFWTANTPRMIIDNEGFLGLGAGFNFNPAHPIHHEATGARLTTGGVWTNGSSRDLKEDIRELLAEDAFLALEQLAPVRFYYKAEPSDETVGFIAEDVPALVASPDHKTLSPMDIVAVLTKVVQEQEKRIAELETALADLRRNDRKAAEETGNSSLSQNRME